MKISPSHHVLLLNLLQMRAGTQTLIQALQALPWMANSGSDHDDDIAGESGSEDDEQPQGM